MRIDEVKTNDDLEKLFNKRRKIKFEDNIEIKSRKDILKNTYAPDHSLATFYKKGTLHCKKNKARSIVDILMLCKYYFPQFTNKENFEYIKEFNKSLTNDIYVFYCSNIRKHNFHGQSNWASSSFRNIKKFYLFNNLKVDINFNVIK